MEEMLYVFPFTFFSLPLIFPLMAACISPFLHRRYKFFLCFSSNEIGLLWFLSLALSSSPVIHVNVDIEIKSK